MTWHRSSYCDTGISCVWVDIQPDVVLVRGDDDGHMLMFTRPEWAAFLAGAKAGEFDLEPSQCPATMVGLMGHEMGCQLPVGHQLPHEAGDTTWRPLTRG